MKTKEVRSIAVAGAAGSGKTSVANGVGEILGWEVFGAGGDFRGSRAKHGIANIGARSGSDAEHDEIDNRMYEMMLGGNSVVEGRVAGLVAVRHNLVNVAKVLLVCDDEMSFKRIYERDRSKYSDLDEARRVTQQRESENLEIFSERYGMSYLDRSLYDLIINTGSYKLVDTVRMVMDLVNSTN